MEAVADAISYLFGEQRIYWFFAIFGSSVFCLQIVLAMMGIGVHSDTDFDADGQVEFGEHGDTGFGDFKFFSLRTIFAFITFFGWGGVLYGKGGMGSFFAGCAAGTAMMFATAMILHFLMRLQQSGNIYPQDYINCKGKVYLTVPGGKTDSGLVTVHMGNCTRQVKAVAETELKTGTPVIVEEHLGGDLYRIKPQ